MIDKKRFQDKLCYFFENEHFQFGYNCTSYIYICHCLLIDEVETVQAIKNLYDSKKHENGIVLGITRILGRFKKYPEFIEIAENCLENNDDEIYEMGIRFFEKHPDKESFQILTKAYQNMNDKREVYLRLYLRTVLTDIYKQLEQ